MPTGASVSRRFTLCELESGFFHFLFFADVAIEFDVQFDPLPLGIVGANLEMFRLTVRLSSHVKSCLFGSPKSDLGISNSCSCGGFG